MQIINSITDKIGYSTLLLSKKIDNLSHTKLLKLLYIIDESSVKQLGVPVTWLNYEVWKNGPVPKFLWTEIKHNSSKTILNNYVSIEQQTNKKDNSQISKFIYPKIEFDEDIFSDYEINLIDTVVEKYGKSSSNELIEMLHKEDTIWHRMWHNELQNEIIDFEQLTVHDPILHMAYTSSKESILFSQKIVN